MRVLCDTINFLSILSFVVCNVNDKTGLVGENAAKPEEIEQKKMKAVFKEEIRSYSQQIKQLQQTIDQLKNKDPKQE